MNVYANVLIQNAVVEHGFLLFCKDGVGTGGEVYIIIIACARDTRVMRAMKICYANVMHAK